ncbi:hypothetical protein [Pelagibius sp. Alg239-R121]|uniref:hypothetical protein n=1 Tax=Pelagibius sp. Alg239-R121 TaxID=2993448 RepID=UPI0024A62940|nr:hypothetical protein [Pelagibius sp. Alg239-R121]
MSEVEHSTGLSIRATGKTGHHSRQSWQSVATFIVTFATGTVAVGLGVLYFLVSAPH